FRALITRPRVFACDFSQDPSRAGTIPPPNPSPAHRRTPRIVRDPGSHPSGTRRDDGRDSPPWRAAIRSCGRDLSPQVEGVPARGRIRVRPSLRRPPPGGPTPPPVHGDGMVARRGSGRGMTPRGTRGWVRRGCEREPLGRGRPVAYATDGRPPGGDDGSVKLRDLAELAGYRSRTGAAKSAG